MSECMWCSKPSTHLCDAVIAFEAVGCFRGKAGRVESLMAGLDGKQWTCDAPMCDEHAHRIGWISGSDPETIDHCPHHVSNGERDMRDLIMFANEVPKARSDLYAAIRRARMRQPA